MHIDAQLVEDVKKKSSRPPPSIEEVLHTTAEIKDQGNEAFRAGDFALAAYSLYISALKTRYGGSRYFIEGTREGKFARRMDHGLMSFRILSNLVVTLLRLQRWVDAHTKATNFLGRLDIIEFSKEKTNIPPGELAKLHHRRALASEGMGKIDRAIEEMHEALCLDPTNTRMKAKLKEWKLQRVQAALKALTT